MKELVTEQLRKIAKLKSKPFCYGCYKDARSGICVECGSDDLMRSLPGVGCEYGLEWVIEEILKEVETSNTDELFEDSIRSCYPEEIKIGWISVDTVSAIKELDPISWDMAKSEWLDSEATEANLLTFDNGANYYEPYYLINQLNEIESKLQ